MPIENRNLEPGTKLVARYKKETYRALVVAGEDGRVKYQLTPQDGKAYKSPSSLGTAVTQKACNGWAFWSVDTSEAQEAGTATPTEPDAPASEAERLEEPTYVPGDGETGPRGDGVVHGSELDHERAPRRAWRADAMIEDQVYAGTRRERGQPF